MYFCSIFLSANYVPVTPTEEFHACLSYPCHMTSTCIDLPSATFVCICRPNYTGLLCDEEINKRDYEVPSFDGKSYIRMNRLKAYYKFSIEIEFKTYADNGIILYNQQKNDGTGDFVSLAIINGSVLEFSVIIIKQLINFSNLGSNYFYNELCMYICVSVTCNSNIIWEMDL